MSVYTINRLPGAKSTSLVIMPSKVQSSPFLDQNSALKRGLEIADSRSSGEKKTLDIGCGPGLSTYYMAALAKSLGINAQNFGVDPNERAINYATSGQYDASSIAQGHVGISPKELANISQEAHLIEENLQDARKTLGLKKQLDSLPDEGERQKLFSSSAERKAFEAQVKQAREIADYQERRHSILNSILEIFNPHLNYEANQATVKDSLKGSTKFKYMPDLLHMDYSELKSSFDLIQLMHVDLSGEQLQIIFKKLITDNLLEPGGAFLADFLINSNLFIKGKNINDTLEKTAGISWDKRLTKLGFNGLLRQIGENFHVLDLRDGGKAPFPLIFVRKGDKQIIDLLTKPSLTAQTSPTWSLEQKATTGFGGASSSSKKTGKTK